MNARLGPALLALALPAALFAHGGEDHGAGHTAPPARPAPPKELEAGAFRFQVAFDDVGLMVMPNRKDGAPVAAGKLAAKVVLKKKGGKTEEATLTPVWEKSGAFRHFDLRRDFTGVADGSVRAEFKVRGLDPAGDLSFYTILRRSASPAHDHAAAPPAKASTYPLGTCVVSGEKLGEHGAPIEYNHQGRTVLLCCKSCVKDFKKDPQRYLGMIDQAAAQPKAGSGSSHEGHEGQGGHDHGGGGESHSGGHDHAAHGH